MANGGDVIAELTGDHRVVEDLFRRIDSLPSGYRERRKLVDRMTIELVRHSVAEEQYLYPAVREYVDGGNALADKETADHARVERTLKRLEKRGEGNVEFENLLVVLKEEVASHVADEENNLFPRLRAACDQEVLDGLGEKVRTAKRLAPTRPHPAAPDQPPANKLLAPVTGLVDRVRDVITRRGKT